MNLDGVDLFYEIRLVGLGFFCARRHTDGRTEEAILIDPPRPP